MNPADLRTWQASMGFTQGQAAKALGMGLSNYSNLVNGARRHTGKPIDQLDRRTELACLALSAGLGKPIDIQTTIPALRPALPPA